VDVIMGDIRGAVRDRNSDKKRNNEGNRQVHGKGLDVQGHSCSMNMTLPIDTRPNWNRDGREKEKPLFEISVLFKPGVCRIAPVFEHG
jgi:hypothetical protein